MDPETLRRQLTALHEELRQTEQLDPRSGELLAEVLGDIHRLLDSPGAAPAAAIAQPAAAPGTAPLTERLELAAVRFEADHPGLAASSRRLIDLLGKAGL